MGRPWRLRDTPEIGSLFPYFSGGFPFRTWPVAMELRHQEVKLKIILFNILKVVFKIEPRIRSPILAVTWLPFDRIFLPIGLAPGPLTV
jgi:hypothetical protein